MAPSKPNDETTLDDRGLASVTFTVNWSDDRATHEDRLHIENFSVWREAGILPPDIGLKIPGMRAGGQAQVMLQPGDVINTWERTRQISTKLSGFDRRHRKGLEVEPRLGRFYPAGFFQGIHGLFSDAALPARITRLRRDRMDVDLNHPLARFPMRVEFRLERRLPDLDRYGGDCTSPMDDLLRYPGLAAPLADGRDADYGDHGKGMLRIDNGPDALFYTRIRLVQHLDRRALETVNTLYRRLIPARAEVLDLMASFDSHLQGTSAGRLHVLGMNAEELSANRAADNRVAQDLNDSPALPFPTNSLDAIACTASIEYLVRPADVLAEARRVLRPGGVFAVTFSNRWFPSKAIAIWSELHEFERVGMITQWLRQAGFADLHTLSSRGWPRPADDLHAGETPHSDPVYAVWGFKAQA